MTGGGQPERFAPSAAEFELLGRAALNRLPEPFAAHLGDVALIVEDFADEATLAEMGFDDPFELTGLYSGRAIDEPMQSGDLPNTVHLFRQPLLAEWCETGVSLEALVTHVVIHEIGHHFGLSDEDMHALEDAAG